MKRLLLVLMLLLSIFGVAHAEYPAYLNGDPNYPCVGGHMGQGIYLDISSVKVLEANHPIYKLSYQALSVGDADRGNVYNFTRISGTYLYNTGMHKMYSYYNGQYNYVPPVGSMADTGHFYPGEFAFYYAFGKRFYGGQKWYNKWSGTYEEANCTGLYRMLGLE